MTFTRPNELINTRWNTYGRFCSWIMINLDRIRNAAASLKYIDNEFNTILTMLENDQDVLQIYMISEL